jgi:FkbM family methyltransferase
VRVLRPASEALALAVGDYGEFEGAVGDRVVFGTYRATGTWSPALVALLARRLLRAGQGTLLDVGANIGLIAIAVAERSRAQCIAFEPEPRNAQLLARNVARHGLQQRIELHAIALDAQAGRALLAVSDDNWGDHRLLPELRASSAAGVIVPAARLDDVLAGRTLQRPCVMKLDTQGAEARVLRGAERVLSQVDALVVEYWPAGLLRAGDSAQALFALLASFPYAGVLDPRVPLEPLEPTAAFLRRLAWIPQDGSDEGFFDLIVSRRRDVDAL